MGGGVMRTAAKAAAFGGCRAAQAPWRDPAAAAAAGATRRSSRPQPATLSMPGQASEGAPLLVSAVSSSSSAQSVPERTSWATDDWELAGGEEEEKEFFEAAPRPAPARLVFAPIPTLEEAKEATSDLKDALDKLYFSPAAIAFEGSAVARRSPSTLSESSCLEMLDPKDKYGLPSASRHVVQAFSLLQGCPEAQDVVASLASDKNVWDAVLKNEKVMEFYKTHQMNASTVESTKCREESVNEDRKCMDNSVGREAPASAENGFMGFMNSIRARVTQMVNNLSDFFGNLMGATGSSSSPTLKMGTSEGSFVDAAVGGASFFVLAITAILVILLKRG